MNYLSIWELPENEKTYEVICSDGLSFYISGEEKLKLLSSSDQFIQTKKGEVFNRSFIRAIVLCKNKTKENAINKKLLIQPTEQQLKEEYLFDENTKTYKLIKK